MTPTRCPFAEWRPITANHTVGGRREIRGFVPHVQVGTGSLWGFFNTPKPKGEGASADFWCSKTGKLEQYVDLADQSWAQGSRQHNGNPYFVSCEFDGVPGEPMTAEQIAVGGRLIAWIRAEINPFALQVNLDPDGEGVTPHHVFGGGHTCPGPGPREGQFPDLIAAAQPAPAQEEDMPAAPAVVINGPEEWTFIRGTDGHLWARSKAKDWFTLGGTLTSGPSATVVADGRMVINVRGADAATWRLVLDADGGILEDWKTLGGAS